MRLDGLDVAEPLRQRLRVDHHHAAPYPNAERPPIRPGRGPRDPLPARRHGARPALPAARDRLPERPARRSPSTCAGTAARRGAAVDGRAARPRPDRRARGRGARDGRCRRPLLRRPGRDAPGVRDRRARRPRGADRPGDRARSGACLRRGGGGPQPAVVGVDRGGEGGAARAAHARRVRGLRPGRRGPRRAAARTAATGSGSARAPPSPRGARWPGRSSTCASARGACT